MAQLDGAVLRNGRISGIDDGNRDKKNRPEAPLFYLFFIIEPFIHGNMVDELVERHHTFRHGNNS